MKAYTDLEQSKKLAEILPLESSDMSYDWFVIGKEYSSIPQCRKFIDDELPCWSLTALVNVLPFHVIVDNQRYSFSAIKGLDKNGETYAIKYAIFNTTFNFYLTDYYNNPIDACYEMILKLNEEKLL